MSIFHDPASGEYRRPYGAAALGASISLACDAG